MKEMLCEFYPYGSAPKGFAFFNIIVLMQTKATELNWYELRIDK